MRDIEAEIRWMTHRQLAIGVSSQMASPRGPMLTREPSMVNGPEKVFVERRGKLELSGVRFRDAGHMAHVCQRIAGRIGRRIGSRTAVMAAASASRCERQRDGVRRVAAGDEHRP